MAIANTCPSCKTVLKIPETMVGKRLRCPKCAAVFVGSAPPPVVDAPPMALIAPPEASGSMFELITNDAVRAGDAPRPKAKSPPSPPPPMLRASSPKPSRAEKGHPGDRRGRTSAKASSIARSPQRSMLPIVIVGIAAVVLVAAGLGVAAVFWMGKDRGDAPAVARANPQADPAVDGIQDGGGVVVDEVAPPARGGVEVVPAQLEIPPAKFAEDKAVREMPDAIADVVVGGSGRYLFLHLPAVRKIAMFDVTEAKIVHYFPAADDKVHMAAGANKLIVFLGGANVIQRYDLTKKERELSAPSPVTGVVKSIAMGSASEGPILMFWAVGTAALDRASVDFVDIKTLRTMEIANQGGGRGHASYRDHLHYRAAANGQVFGAWATSHSPSGVHSLVLTGNSVRSHYEHDSRGHVLPSPDGKFIYTFNGAFTSEIKRIGDSRPGEAQIHLPAIHGDYYLRLNGVDRFGGRPGKNPANVTVQLAGDSRPLATLPDLGLDLGNRMWMGQSFTLDKRIHFIPDAKVIVVIPETNRQVTLHRFDIADALEKSGIDYLLVMSRPPLRATSNEPYAYQISVKSKKGVKGFRLEAGPEGMTISKSGRLTWVPRLDQGGEHNIIISVTDKAEQEIFHTFKIAVSRVFVAAPAGAAPKNDDDIVPPREVAKAPEPRVEPKEWREEAKNRPAPPRVDPPVGEEKRDPVPADRFAFSLPPLPASLPIVPPPHADEKTVTFPDTIGTIVPAGGGRFLIAHLPKTRQLAIFDVNEAKVVKFLPVAADKVILAGGMNKFVVILPNENIMQRWSLATFQREVAVGIDMPEKVQSAAMGHASAGPLMLVSASNQVRNHYALFDLETFRKFDAPVAAPFGGFQSGANYVKAAANGRSFLLRAGPNGSTIVSLTPNGVVTSVAELGAFYPSPNGKVLFGNGMFTSQGKRQGRVEPIMNPRFGKILVPALRGDFYLTVPTGRFHPQIADEKRFGPVTVHLVGDSRPIATLERINGDFRDLVNTNQDALGLDQRYSFVPEAKSLMVIPSSADRIEVHRVDIDDLLEKSEVDYLFVASQAVDQAKPGREYRYSIQTRSKRGGVSYTLDSGPDGMAVSPEGVVTWNVPDDHPQRDVPVILNIKDKSDQEIFHTYSIAIVDTLLDPVEVAKIAPAPKNAPAPEPKRKEAAPKIPARPPAEAPIDPAAATNELKPAVFDGEMVERSLPAVFDSVVVGGGGRYLLFSMPSLRKVALFDANEAKIVHYFPIAGDQPLLAAGRNKMVMVFPGTKIAQRWDLHSKQKELTVPLEIDLINNVALGSASDGPLFVSGGDRLSTVAKFFDLKTFRPREFGVGDRNPHARGFRNNIRVSADGSVFGTWSTGLSPSGLGCFAIVGNQLNGYYEHTSVGHIVPGPDGKFLYTANGVYTNQVQASQHADARKYTVPSVHGDYYLVCSFGDDRVPSRKQQKSEISVHLAGESRPLLTQAFDFGTIDRFDQRGPVRMDQRIHFIPGCRVLVYLPTTNDKIAIHRLDIDAALERSEIDYLYVTSRPPIAIPGKDFIYPLTVKSRKGGVTYRMESGPEGMAVSKEGVVTWRAPEGALPAAAVIITVSDRSGQEVFHSFKMRAE